jgi:predicted nucleic acid-binding protein
VLLYSVDPADPSKQERAWQWLTLLWQQRIGRLSWQVLHEFYVNAVRKLLVKRTAARTVARGYAQWRPVETNLGLLERAWYWTDTAELAYWDGLIVAAAEQAGCGWLLSEDFQDGRRFGIVTVVNPFTHIPEELLSSPPR